MKSDWHRYNLKRRVASLPSISLEVFEAKVSEFARPEDIDVKVSQKEAKRKRKDEILRQKQALILEGLSKATQKEEKEEKEEKKEVVEQDESNVEPANEEPVNEEDEEALAEKLLKVKLQSQVKIPNTLCLFCKNVLFDTIEANVDHMFKSHGMFIPEQKYLDDLPGLLDYLGEKVGLGNVCLVCNYQGKNIEAVRAHMLSKCHCRLPYETEDEKMEISEFYDFSSTYTSKTAGSSNADEWEDVSDNDDQEDDEQEELPREVLYSDGVELHLPNGVKIGHRSMVRYFKQDLKPEKELTEGQGTVIAAESRHLVSAADKKENEIKKLTWKTQIYNKKRDDKRAAKFINNQPHFRDPLLQ